MNDGVPGVGYAIKDWSHLGGSVWARKTITNSVTLTAQGGTVTFTEQTTFDLKYAPE